MGSSFFVNMGFKMWVMLKSGLIGSVFTKICDCIWKMWTGSLVYDVLFLRKMRFDIKGSFAYKMMFLPFKILNKMHVKLKFDGAVIQFFERSMNSTMRINTRFFGIYLAIILAGRMVMTRGVDVIGVAGVAVGLFGVLANYDILKGMRDSYFVSFAFRLVDLEIPLINPVKKGVDIRCGAVLGVVTKEKHLTLMKTKA